MTPDESHVLNADDNVKSAASKWLFTQGASTVLLTGILMLGAYYWIYVRPEEMKQMRADAERLASQTAADLKQSREDFREILKSHDDTIGRVLDGVSRSMDKVSDKLEGLKR